MSWISDIADVGGKLVGNFLSLDDLVAGQGVVGGGLAQLAQAGRLGAGSVLVSSNLAARTFQLGVQAGAKTARVTAEALEGVVPGIDAARGLAARVDAASTAAAEEASLLAARGVQMTAGRGGAPKNPLTRQPWLGKETPPGYTWTELTADTVVGPFGRIALLPLTLGLDTVEAAAASGVGRRTIDATIKAVSGALGLVSSSRKLDDDELREALLAVTSSTGRAIVRDFVAIAEAATRFTLGDTRRVERGMREGLEELRLLARHPDLDELLPALPISKVLRDRARKIVANPPKHFLASIEKRPPRPGEVFKALIEDAGPLRDFIVNFPQVVTLLGTNTGLVLAAGLFDVGEIEDFVRGDGDKSAPWSAVGFEDYVGQAVLGKTDPQLGYYPESAVYLARDVSFLYSTEVLGRGKALARVERLYGEEARERVEDDVSLDLDLLRTEAGEAREERLRERVDEADDADLERLRDRGRDQLASLEAFAGGRFQYVPKQVGERIDALRYFLSIANQRLALGRRGGEDGGRRAARRAFDDWVDARPA